MGTSIVYKIDVLRLIATRIEPTLALVLASVVLSILIAVPLAALAARNQGRRLTTPSASSRPSASAFRPSGSG